jgi:hypothetical protein
VKTEIVKIEIIENKEIVTKTSGSTISAGLDRSLILDILLKILLDLSIKKCLRVI